MFRIGGIDVIDYNFGLNPSPSLRQIGSATFF